MSNPLPASPARLRSVGLVTAAAVLLSVGALASAQRGGFGSAPGMAGAGGAPGAGLHRGAMLASVTIDFYAVDPGSDGATPIASVEFDTPLSRDEILERADAEGATYAVVRGMVSHTLDLEALAEAGATLRGGLGTMRPFDAPGASGPMSGPRGFGAGPAQGTPFGHGPNGRFGHAPMGPAGTARGGHVGPAHPQHGAMHPHAGMAHRGARIPGAGAMPGGAFGQHVGPNGAARMRGLHERLHRNLDAAPVAGLLRNLARIADGSTVTIRFFDADPAAGGAVVDTVTWIAGDEDPIAIRDQLRASVADAAWIEMDVDGQPFELPTPPRDTSADTDG